ncbi:hypothetical protein BUALT_Bualt10G0043800 [Buddleja alternifolia]|uniref:Protein FAR1-RELATED SEQUENCE n=1 Tax=Buddleja alternifolia TaxID=168488 RepID=A0AAV6WWU3_9LAMI|nr:hypothetical protein BUALT_Bualt10G0043800 [Buddleja alternifolia]
MDKDTCVHELTPRRKLDFVVHGENEFLDNSGGEKAISERHSNISEEKIPKIGMEFETEKAAFMFYNEYARLAGFSVRKYSVHRDKNERIIDRTFFCSCRGYRPKDKRDVSVKSHHSETRNGCCAMMKVDGRFTGKFKVVSFVADHNGHDLVSPSKSHLLRSHRIINAILASQADDMESSGIAPKAGFALMVKQAGGREQVGFIFEDYKNYLRLKRTMDMKIGDTGGVLEYLQQRQLDDPNFFYAIQVDEHYLIANILWVDAQMMADYAHFGDVVSFDTTYRKNKEGRPFALFVGVNHHKQTIVFGASLLYDETASTFMWLFDTFARAMSGKKPMTMLTDQDAAMAKALAEKWPDTCHRLCIWHIYQNAAIHLSSVFARFANFAKDFSSCIYDYEEEEEFITAWNEMLKNYELQTNEWLLIDDRRYEELKADLRTSRSTLVAYFPIEVLKHAATVYTHKVFELFQEELRKAYDSKIELFGEIGEISEYKITPFRKHHQHTLVTRASLTMDTFQIVKIGILKMIEEVDASLENKIDITIRPKTLVQNNAMNEVGNKPNEIMIRGWKNKGKKYVKTGKRPKSGLEKSIRKRKQKKGNVPSLDDAIIDTENNEQKSIRKRKQKKGNVPSLDDAIIDTENNEQIIRKRKQKKVNVPSLDDAIIDTENNEQMHGENSPNIGASIEHSSLPTLSQLSQQQIAKPQALGRIQLNNFTHQGEHEKANGGSSDVPKY